MARKRSVKRSQYPEHEKLQALDGQNQCLGEFLEWLSNQGYVICVCRTQRIDDVYMPAYKPISRWLAEYFGIDEVKLENEKRAMIDELRRRNKERD